MLARMLDLSMTKKRFVFVTVATALLCSGFYWCCGLFIAHPLAASSQGATYVYWRPGAELPFLSSADGLLLNQASSKKPGERNADAITPAARGEALSKTSDVVLQRRILKLPYSRELYLMSTDGIELDR
jgi:hypothetical protein